jgi:NTP pyrophosphatase (non-canonical NTP hydrolase)
MQIPPEPAVPQNRLRLDQYQDLAITADQTPNEPLAFHLLGLFGEAGSLLSVAKKKQRDSRSYIGYTPHVVEELGDVLWYFAVVAKRGNIRLSEIARNLNSDHSTWSNSGSAALGFEVLQSDSSRTSPRLKPTRAFEKTLLHLAGDVGAVLAEHKNGHLSNNRDALKGALIRVMRSLVTAANESGVTLEQAAQSNLIKIFDRWPLRRAYPDSFDTLRKIPLHERLPQKLTIDIIERNIDGRRFVFQQYRGVNIGDRLTDNAAETDDYRFHDVFHYANCAVLTWSPVVRSLLHLKRKSKSQIDEVEDGARANLTEEGISAWIFKQAQELSFFAGVKRGQLSFDILKTIRQFVKGYEPYNCPLWLWEDAILQGYSAFRFLKQHRRGRVHIDMTKRRLIVENLPK